MKQGIEPTFVDGVVADLSLMERPTYDERRFRRRYGRSSIPSEVAAVLAHQRAYARVAAGAEPAALVLEDDAVPSAGFAEIAAATASALAQGDVALLFHNGLLDPLRLGRVALPLGHELAYLHRREPQGAVATVVTREAAARLAAFRAPVRSSPDDWHLFSSRVVVRAVFPPVAGHDDDTPSAIGPDRFTQRLDPPRLPAKVSWKVRTSRAWSSPPSRAVREVALLARAHVLRRAQSPGAVGRRAGRGAGA